MCGLVAFLSNKALPSGENAVEAMSHRGLTAQVAVVGNYTLGHVRLPIINLSPAADQPMKVSRITVMLVGEILNYKELYPDAESDTEALGRMWLDQGRDGFHLFDGFWSAVITDGHDIFFYVDHLAIKPLYYTPYMVASELSAIEAVYGRALTEDPIFFSNVLKWGYDPTGRTPWKEVKRMPPGTFMSRNMTPIGYWDWNKVSYSDIRGELTQAVDNRLVGDRPVALLLSGGLDSTIIFRILTQELGVTDLTVFHAENGEQDALNAALGDFQGSALPVTLPTPEEAVKALQMPVDIGSLLPQYALGKAVRDKGFYVVMSGDGADELFGGYSRAAEYDSQASDVFVELPLWHLPRLDAVMMYHTVELRSPYLAPGVVKSALALNWIKRRRKEALKRAFEDLLPSFTLALPKKPLKSTAVIHGGVPYRKDLINIWRSQHA